MQNVLTIEADKPVSIMKEKLREAHETLRATVAAACQDISSDVRLLKIKLPHKDSEILGFPLYRGTWVPSQSGLEMMLIDDLHVCNPKTCVCGTVCSSHRGCNKPDMGCTRVLCRGRGNVELHSHQYSEFVQVIQGVWTERSTGRVYHAGDTIYYAPEEDHEPYIDGMVMICWRPPLTKEEEENIHM